MQRVPEIFTSLKAAIDARRAAGRFILTGSANVLLVPHLADSLAGRMGILRLHPLAQCEIEGTRSRFLDDLLRGRFRTGLSDPLGRDLARRIVDGGYPAALARRSPARRRAWYRDYVETQIQRDVRDLSRVRSLDTLPKLLRVAATHTASLINVADLAAPFDAAVAIGYCEYLADPVAHLARMKALVTGDLVVSFPKRYTLRTLPRALRYQLRGCYLRFFTAGEIRRLADQAGLRVIAVHSVSRDYLLHARTR